MDTNTPANSHGFISPAKRRVLLIIEQCNPHWASVPLVGYEFYQGLRQLADITLVTHQRNQPALETVRHGHDIHYMRESKVSTTFYRFIARLSNRGSVNWPLLHALSYPLYDEFNRQVYQQFGPAVRQGEFDLVHAMTPMIPRYPYKIIKACQNTPFILGPVNGGVPFPKNFQDIAWREFAQYNFLRAFTYIIPGYTSTYRQADYIFAGSSFTLDFLKRSFSLSPEKIELFPENGLSPEFFQSRGKKQSGGPLQLLFVGRLVPYKGADILIDAIANLPHQWRQQVHLSIVGDGPERQNLEAQVLRLELVGTVSFAGWVDQKKTKDFYGAADIFCFPSIREFGGAVVLEAMASGLPSIVVDNGGIAEYVTTDCGFKIEPRNREYLVEKLADHIAQLCQHDQLRQVMGDSARKRAEEFAWDQKARHLVETYEKVLARRGSPCHPLRP